MNIASDECPEELNMEAFNPYKDKLNEVMKPILDKREDFPLFHYTSAAALYSILEHNELWFTKWNCLNDPSEFRHIHDIIKSELKQYRQSDKEFFNTITSFNNFDIQTKRDDSKWTEEYNIFILSFTKAEDSLNMWNCYTKSSQADGYSIKFKIPPYRKVVNNTVTPPEKLCSEIKLTPVTYNIDEQENIVREALKILLSVYNTHDISDDEKIRIIIELFDSFVLEMGCRFKHEKYKSEQEVRAILDLHETDLVYVRHRASNGIVIPYVPLKICPYSIEEIRISPTLQGRPAMSGLKSLKTIKKLTFDITQSEIPFRNI